MKIHKFKNSSVEYNPNSGWFFWIVCYKKPWLNGKQATREMPNGYLYIKADGKGNLANSVRNPGISGTLGVSIYNRPSGNGHLWRARYKGMTKYFETKEEAVTGYAKLASEACDK